MSQHPDEHYIERVLNGDQSSFAILVERHKNMAFTIANRMLKNREEAEEIAQDAFLKAYKSLKDFKHKSKFSTWFYKIVYNLSLSQLRKKKSNVFSIDENEDNQHFELPDIAYKMDELENQDRKKYLEKAIGQLNEDEQTIILFFYHEDLSSEEISEIVNLTVSNVKVKLFRARKKLYEHLNQLLKSETNNIL